MTDNCQGQSAMIVDDRLLAGIYAAFAERGLEPGTAPLVLGTMANVCGAVIGLAKEEDRPRILADFVTAVVDGMAEHVNSHPSNQIH